MKKIRAKLKRLLQKIEALTNNNRNIKTPTLYLNENIPVQIINHFSRLGIKSIHTHQVENNGISDEAQLIYAAKNKYILVTHNRKHFLKLHKEWMSESKKHYGIITIGQKGSNQKIAERIYNYLENDFHKANLPFCITPPK